MGRVVDWVVFGFKRSIERDVFMGYFGYMV